MSLDVIESDSSHRDYDWPVRRRPAQAGQVPVCAAPACCSLGPRRGCAFVWQEGGLKLGFTRGHEPSQHTGRAMVIGYEFKTCSVAGIGRDLRGAARNRARTDRTSSSQSLTTGAGRMRRHTETRASETPTFDRLARDGVLVENAYISSPSCTPSRGAIITGQQFWRLGPRRQPLERLAVDRARVSQAVGRRGILRGKLPQRLGARHVSLYRRQSGRARFTTAWRGSSRRVRRTCRFASGSGPADPHRPYHRRYGSRERRQA